jgi:hypothetical protein
MTRTIQGGAGDLKGTAMEHFDVPPGDEGAESQGKNDSNGDASAVSFRRYRFGQDNASMKNPYWDGARQALAKRCQISHVAD